MTNSSTLVYTIHTSTYLHVSSTAIQIVSSSIRSGLFQNEEKLVAEYLEIMRTNAPSLWCKPKTGILCSLCMPQRQRPVLLFRMPTADADLYSWPACHLLFRMEGMRCFLVSCTIVLRQPHSYLLVTSLIHDVIEAYNHSISLLRIRRVVPTGVHE